MTASTPLVQSEEPLVIVSESSRREHSIDIVEYRVERTGSTRRSRSFHSQSRDREVPWFHNMIPLYSWHGLVPWAVEIRLLVWFGRATQIELESGDWSSRLRGFTCIVENVSSIGGAVSHR